MNKCFWKNGTDRLLKDTGLLQTFNTKLDKDATQKRKIQANITDEHRCKNPEQNSSNQNPTTH